LVWLDFNILFVLELLTRTINFSHGGHLHINLMLDSFMLLGANIMFVFFTVLSGVVHQFFNPAARFFHVDLTLFESHLLSGLYENCAHYARRLHSREHVGHEHWNLENALFKAPAFAVGLAAKHAIRVVDHKLVRHYFNQIQAH
jgi:hypothetical protein